MDIFRVRELLDEIAECIKKMQAEISKGNSKLGGVLDTLLLKTEEAKSELAERKTSPKALMSFVKMFADLIEIIVKIQDTLFYKIRCYLAAFNMKRDVDDHWKEHKVIQDYCWA